MKQTCKKSVTIILYRKAFCLFTSIHRNIGYIIAYIIQYRIVMRPEEAINLIRVLPYLATELPYMPSYVSPTLLPLGNRF